MGISTGAAILGSSALSAASSFLGGSSQASSAMGAFGLTEEAIRASIAEQRRQYDQTREDFAPYREFGANALAQYAALFGIGRGPGGGEEGGSDEPEFITETFQTGTHPVTTLDFEDTTGEGDWAQVENTRNLPTYGTRQVRNPNYREPGNAFLSRDEMQAARDRFMETPGYTFRFDEGLRALDRSASARGKLNSGAQDRALVRYGQGIGSDEFNNYANRLAGIAGMGQGATQSVATLGQNSANNISNTLMAGAGMQGNALMAAGTARASGFAGAGNALANGANSLLLMRALGEA